MTAQIELDLGPPGPAPLHRLETPREKSLRLLNGRKTMPFCEALQLLYADAQRRAAAGDWPPGRRTR